MKNKIWQCPNCGWIMTDLQYRTVKFDFGCPRCQTKFSEFRSRGFLKTDLPPNTSISDKTSSEQPEDE